VRIRLARSIVGLALALALVPPLAAHSPGKLLGVVLAKGAPQLGATVILTREGAARARSIRLVSNARGIFQNASLAPGVYSVQVELAGFLPTVEHVRILSARTMLLRVELESGLTSLDRLRDDPAAKGADEWPWVLRTSAATRPVLRWVDGQVVLGDEASASESAKKRTRGRVELTSGALRPGSVANLADSPATAFVYDQALGSVSDLLLAGEVSYERSAAAGFVATWLPDGKSANGPATTLVLRQAKLGPEGPNFRAIRIEQNEHLEVGNRVQVLYGGELIAEGAGALTTSMRPHAKVAMRLAKTWQASFAVEAAPPPDRSLVDDSLESTLTELDAFPTFLLRDGRPVLDNGWHEEFAVAHPLGQKTRLVAAAFRDQSAHTAVFGRGAVANPNFFQDSFSNAFAYDGGPTADWGARLALERKLSRDLEAALVYAWAGALSADEQQAGAPDLRNLLDSTHHHCLGGRLSGSFNRWGTRFAASYLWVQGNVVTAPDPYGEAAYGVEPFLNLSVRQPLPAFLCCRLEALADFRNLLAQGYVPVLSRDGQTLLMPAMRTFRGGVSVQF
jgi:Carboxypeptidase regulatory-like domain